MTFTIKVLCADEPCDEHDGAKNLEVGSRKSSVVSKKRKRGISHG
jgi:hypothetical protein